MSPDSAGVWPSSDKPQSFSVDMTARANALDDFLAEIATLVETHRMVQPHFQE